MFSSIDKAIVAAIMALLSILELTYGWTFGLSQETIGVIIAALSPILVWLVPNRTE